MFKVNDKNTKRKFDTCSKLTIKTPERMVSGKCCYLFSKNTLSEMLDRGLNIPLV